MSSTFRLVGLLAASLVLAACGGGSTTSKKKNIDDRIAEACTRGDFSAPAFAAGVIGGRVVKEDSWLAHKVVLLAQKYSGDEVALCTATLLSPDVMLTAAHCVERAGASETYAIFASQPACESIKSGGPVAKTVAQEIRIHPNYLLSNNGQVVPPSAGPDLRGMGDLALVRLSQPAPANFEPVDLVPRAIPWSDVDTYLVAGYGWSTTAGRDEIPQLRAALVPPLSRAKLAQARSNLPDPADQRRFDERINQNPDSETIFLDQENGTGLCHGDSGGPTFVRLNGKNFQIGVASQVIQATEAQTCQVVGLSTNLYFHRAWIRKTFAQLSSGSLRSASVR